MTAVRHKRRHGMVTVTEAAGHLNIPKRELFAWLRREGWLLATGQGNTPHAEKIARGLMACDEHVFTHSDGTPDRSLTPLITRAGFGVIRNSMQKESLDECP